MQPSGNATFGVFKRRADAFAARRILARVGLSKSKTAILFPPNEGVRANDLAQRTTVAGGAIMGGTLGAIIFFVLGLMMIWNVIRFPGLEASASLTYQALIIGIMLIAGIGLGAGSGALVGIGTPPRALNRLSNQVFSGGILMSVHVDNESESRVAKNAMQNTGAQEVQNLDESETWKGLIENSRIEELSKGDVAKLDL